MSDIGPQASGPLSAPFWDGCRQGELRVQRCPSCGHHQFYPRRHCLQCGRAGPDWVASGGRGVVVTHTQVHVPLDESWAAEVPYWVALVRLEEGPTLMTNLVDTDQARVGMAVTVQFRTRADGTTLPVFAPTPGAAGGQTAEQEDRR